VRKRLVSLAQRGGARVRDFKLFNEDCAEGLKKLKAERQNLSFGFFIVLEFRI
jgi:hypothetical protein